jgi:hypothetical protein
MHIDWFIVVVVAITVPLAWWGIWLSVKDARAPDGPDEREAVD